MRNGSRFIPGENIAAVEPWDFGSMDAGASLTTTQRNSRTRAAFRDPNSALRQEVFAQGVAQGRAQASAEAQKMLTDYQAVQGQQATHTLAQLFASASAQLAAAEQTIAEGTLSLACEIARQVVRHELSLKPELLLSVIREALTVLVESNQAVVLRLHPLDLELLQASLSSEFTGMALSLRADAALSRGDCVVESAGAVVDATLEKRWQRALANLGLQIPWEGSVDDH